MRDSSGDPSLVFSLDEPLSALFLIAQYTQADRSSFHTYRAGALALYGNPFVEFYGPAKFTGNSAQLEGGAVYVASNTVSKTITFYNTTLFTGNTAGVSGGAIYGRGGESGKKSPNPAHLGLHTCFI